MGWGVNYLIRTAGRLNPFLERSELCLGGISRVSDSKRVREEDMTTLDEDEDVIEHKRPDPKKKR